MQSGIHVMGSQCSHITYSQVTYQKLKPPTVVCTKPCIIYIGLQAVHPIEAGGLYGASGELHNRLSSVQSHSHSRYNDTNEENSKEIIEGEEGRHRW